MKRRVLLLGGGLAGGLSALALHARRGDVEPILVERGDRFGGNHIWSFFDQDVEAGHRWLVDAIGPMRWPSHRIAFPARRRHIGLGYNSLRSPDLHGALLRTLPAASLRLGREAVEVTPEGVRLSDGETITADAVVDARGGGPIEGLDLGWQKFVGRHLRFAVPHGVAEPMIMDAEVDQTDGYRFVYLLPFSATELLVEDTYYSLAPALNVDLLRQRIDAYVDDRIGRTFETMGEETGVLPIVLGGRLDALWPDDYPFGRIGMRGGFFHPTTGYSVPDAVANAMLLTEASDMTTAGLRRLLHDRAKRLWRERGFYRMLNRMLFHAASPRQRYRVLEHFYHLPEASVARFYATRLTALDKLRTLSGKPPVGIFAALSAIAGRA
jgi:lycopene beta-cyclase